MVPGLGALGYLTPAVRACASWTRVHLLDLPGFGHPSTARCPADLTAMSEAVASWLEAACDRPVLLVGHSTGAQAALRAALAVPRRVHALVTAGPTFPPPARHWRTLAAGIARTLPHERPGMIPAAAPEYLRGRLGVLTLMRTAMADAPERHIGQLACPVLVAGGERDAVSPPSWCAHLAAAAPDGRRATVPGGHNFPFSASEVTAAVFREALAG